MRLTMNLLLIVPMIILLDQYEALPLKSVMHKARKIYLISLPDDQPVNNIARYPNAMFDQQSDEDNKSELLQKRGLYVNPMCNSPHVEPVHQGSQPAVVPSSSSEDNAPAYVKPGEKDEEPQDEKGALPPVTQMPAMYSYGESLDPDPILVSESEILENPEYTKNEPVDNKCTCQNNDVPVSAGHTVQPVYAKVVAVPAENETPHNNEIAPRGFVHHRRRFRASYRFGGIRR